MYKFHSYSSLEQLFLDRDLIDPMGEDYFLGSIGDLLYIQEQYKKGKFEIEGSQLMTSFKFISEQLGKDLNKLLMPELDDFILRENLFNEDEDGIIKLDPDINNSNISPRLSISRTVLKVGDHSFWEPYLVDEMEYWNKNYESIE